MSQTLEWTPIHTYLAANWTSTPIDWGMRNQPFDPDDATHTTPHSAGGPWIRPTIISAGGDYQLFTVGVSTAIRERELIIDLFAPVATGASTLGGYAESLRDMFWDLDLGTLEFGVPSLQSMGDDAMSIAGATHQETKWYREQVRIPFEYEHFKGETNVNVGHEREITQAGFFASAPAGTLVYVSGSNTLAKAQADDSGTLATHMVSRVISDDRGAIVAPGCNVAWTGHGGSAGDALYTSSGTAGEVATIAPTAPNWEQQIGGVNADSTIWFYLFPTRRGESA